MAKEDLHQHYYSLSPSSAGSTEAKAPNLADLEYGEIAVNALGTDPTLFIKGTDGTIKKFKSLEAVQTYIKTACDNLEAKLLNNSSPALDSLRELADALGNDKNFAATITNKLTELKTAIDGEISRAKTAEATALTAAQDEATRAKAAEVKLTSDLAAEATRAKAAEAAASSLANAEKARALAAEKEIADDVVSEAKRAATAEAAVSKNIADFIALFNSYFVYDATLDAIKCLKSFYSVGGVAAMGAGPAVAGGGGGIGAIADAVDVAFKDCNAGDILKYDGTHWINTRINASMVDGLQALLDKLVTKEAGKGLSTNDFTTAEKTKLAAIAAGAEVNQNAFANIKVGAATTAASSKSDTFELAAGEGISVEMIGKKITVKCTLKKLSCGTF